MNNVNDTTWLVKYEELMFGKDQSVEAITVAADFKLQIHANFSL